MNLRVAAVQWALRPAKDFASFADHFRELAHRAAGWGADLIVFPEYNSFELLGSRPVPDGEIRAQLVQHAPAINTLASEVAKELKVALIPGSWIQHIGRRSYNATRYVQPDGVLSAPIPKVKLTMYEKRPMRLYAGEQLGKTSEKRVGVTICYDSEFPESGRLVAHRGAMVQVIPAFTESLRGFQRVRWCALARATENQVYVIHASLAGRLGFEPAESTYGTSAILTPSHEDFPETAVLDETDIDDGVAIADLDFELLKKSRRRGDVRNWYDRDPAPWSNEPT